MSQQKGNLFDAVGSRGPRLAGDKHSSDRDGGASWDECLDRDDGTLRCLRQTRALEGRGGGGWGPQSPGSEGLTMPAETVTSLVDMASLQRMGGSSWSTRTALPAAS